MSLRTTAWLTVAALFLVVVSGVLLRPLTPVSETRYAAVAWEMWLTGSYIVPTLNFEIYHHKPPLLFWSVNAVWALFGVSETAARLVPPIYGLVGILLTGLLARRLWPDDPDAGARTMLALCGLLLFSTYLGLNMFDAMLATATVAGMLALLAAARTGARRWWIALGAALALGVLTKGPVILVHLLPAMLLLPLWADRDWPVTWRGAVVGTGVALLAGLALVGLWLVPALVMGGPEYREAVLWTQSAGRIVDSFDHARPWWFFLALMPLLLFPWVFAPALWGAAARRMVWSETGMRLALIWSGAALLAFSLISGKQIHYVIPECAAVALIVGRLSRDLGAFRLTWAVVPLGLAAGLAVAATLGVVPLGDIAPLLEPRWPLLVFAVSMVLVAGAGLRLGGLRGGAVLTLGTILSAHLLIGLTAMRDIYDTHGIARLIAPHQEAGIAFVGQTYHAEFNFAGRLTQPVQTPRAEEIEAWIAAHPGGVVVGRLARVGLPREPDEIVLYRGSPHGLWRIPPGPSDAAP